MSFMRDRQAKHFFIMMLAGLLLSFLCLCLIYQGQEQAARKMLIDHDRTVVSWLLKQGLTQEQAVTAVRQSAVTVEGVALLEKVGLTQDMQSRYLPWLSVFRNGTLPWLILFILVWMVCLPGMTVFFLWKRDRLYEHKTKVVNCYADGDYSVRLSQGEEGNLFRLLSSVDTLAGALRAKGENEHQLKEFLKQTVSDISHQLKTPLAAMKMYHEIIGEEPDHPDTVRMFSEKTRIAIDRMEQLIGALLKIARLDTGGITFQKELLPVREVAEEAVRELRMRALQEGKEIIVQDSAERIFCDRQWTVEAAGNLVKNALDHTKAGGHIRIAWEETPALIRLSVTDDGEGIDPEDFFHIFKRFYRSCHSLDTQGVGLGLPLTKAIVEGQGGTVSVRSGPGEGTVFTLSFPISN